MTMLHYSYMTSQPVSRLDCSRIPRCEIRAMIGPQYWRPSLRDLTLVAAAVFVALATLAPAKAEEPSKCAAAPHLLWGDGEHDDTVALNAWFRGETVPWAQTHEQVGAEIADRSFLLSSTVYVSGGTARRLERF